MTKNRKETGIYKGKKTNFLHRSLCAFNREGLHQTIFLECESLNSTKSSYLVFETNRTGLKALKKEGFKIQKKEFVWFDIKKAPKSVYNGKNADPCTFKAIFEKRGDKNNFILNFALFTYSLMNDDEAHLIAKKDAECEFYSENRKLIKFLLEAGVRIQRRKSFWVEAK